MIPPTREAAMQLLDDVGAPLRLRRHAELVGEAADALLSAFQRLNLQLDVDFVRVGVVLHDVGKTIHISELESSGHSHESAGELMLLERRVSPEVARVCRSHAQLTDVAQTFEELVIALADKLWKGARVTELENRVIDSVAVSLGVDRWQVFTELDGAFEEVAATADSRLLRSVV